jgi:hypothetical protein
LLKANNNSNNICINNENNDNNLNKESLEKTKDIKIDLNNKNNLNDNFREKSNNSINSSIDIKSDNNLNNNETEKNNLIKNDGDVEEKEDINNNNSKNKEFNFFKNYFAGLSNKTSERINESSNPPKKKSIDIKINDNNIIKVHTSNNSSKNILFFNKNKIENNIENKFFRNSVQIKNKYNLNNIEKENQKLKPKENYLSSKNIKYKKKKNSIEFVSKDVKNNFSEYYNINLWIKENFNELNSKIERDIKTFNREYKNILKKDDLAEKDELNNNDASNISCILDFNDYEFEEEDD